MVSGYVTVRVDKDVKCKRLVVKSMWETHGRGNVASETHREAVVFEGDWQAGSVERYRFELECGNWPPTYHGNYLNVDHYIFAQADIPWAFDPKAKTPFQLVPTPGAGADSTAAKQEQQTSLAGKIIGGIILAIVSVVGLLFLFHPCFWIVILAAGVWWFITKYLPKRKLGDIQFTILTPAIAPGHPFRAEIQLQPRGPTLINSVNWLLKAEEICVHGSGTNKSTYRHTVVEHRHQSAAALELTANQTNRFTFDFTIPADSPLSLDLDDNELAWTVQAHVDIPRWPDWKKSDRFQVVHADAAEAGGGVPLPVATEPTPQVVKESGVTFAKTASLVGKVRTDFDQLERVLAAVADIQMQIAVRVERPISTGRIDPAIGYPDGMVAEAIYEPENLPLLLYVPADKRTEIDRALGSTWNGHGMVVGYDQRIGCLQVKVV